MFKPGDLVMIIKPRECCGDDSTIGMLLIVVSSTPKDLVGCRKCNTIRDNTGFIGLSNGTFCEPSRLKKIDPDNGVDEIIRIAGLPKKIPRKKLNFHLDHKRLAF